MHKKNIEQKEFLDQLNERVGQDEILDYVSGSYLRHIQIYGDIETSKIKKYPKKKK